MSYLFSNQVNRLLFLGRCLLTVALFAFAAILFAVICHVDSQSDTVFSLAIAAAVLIALPTLFYFVYFCVISRLRSIGMSRWNTLFLLTPVLAGLIEAFYTTDAMKWASFLPWNGFAIGLTVFFLLFLLFLFIFPEHAFRQGNALQSLLHDFEVGEGRMVIRIVMILLVLGFIGALYNFGPVLTPFGQLGGIYHGLSDAQSMDNAQLARQIARGQGFTTKFIRPYALRQLHDYATSQSIGTGQSGDLFPANRFPPEAERILPDTYNAPGYPYLLATWFYLIHPHFEQPVESLVASHMYIGDRLIPPLNMIFLVLTALLVFALSSRLFDERVAWMAIACFLLSNMVWQFALTAQATSFLMFLVTGILYCTVEIFCTSESSFESEESSFTPAWGWALLLSVLLAVACLTRLHLMVLWIPLAILFLVMPRASFWIPMVVGFLLALAVLPWFWHMYRVSGNPWGSNLPLLLLGSTGYDGNQIYCATTIPGYDSLLRNMATKQYQGIEYHFEHAWELMGYSPLVLLFAATALHQFKRRRALAFFWLLVGCTLVLIIANNFGVSNPEALGPWNNVILLLPGMLAIGSAFFFILFDRLNLHLWIIRNMIVIVMLSLSALPMALTFATSEPQYYNFPPYVPPTIKIVSNYAEPNEWVTTDMPWATAWYGDHASLWLPDSVNYFVNIYDNVNPSGVILFTPVTWSKPMSNVTTGENKEWQPFVNLNVNAIPPVFPLHVPIKTGPGGPEYMFWSDRPRWESQR